MIKLKRLLRNLIITVILIMVSLAVLLSTPWGLQQIINAAAYGLRQGGIALSAHGISGNAFDFNIQSVQLSNDDFKLKANNLHLRWHPWDLLDKQVVISKLSAQTLQILSSTATTSTHQAANSPSLPKIALPWPLSIERIQVAKLGLDMTDLGSLSGSLHWRDTKLSLNQLALVKQDYTAHFSGEINFTDHYPLQGSLNWQSVTWPASGKFSIAGNLEYWVVYNAIQLGNDSRPLGKIVLTALHSADLIKFRLSGNPLGGELNGQGQYELSSRNWQLKLNSQRLNLSLLQASLPEALDNALSLTGKSDQIDLHTSLAVAGNTLSLDVSAAKNAQVWNIAWQDFTLNTAIGSWHTNPVTIRLADQNVHIPLLCLSHQSAALCGQYDFDQGNWQAEAYSKNLSLKLLQGLVPGWRPSGTINFHAKASRNGKTPLNAQAELSLADFGISHPIDTDLNLDSDVLLDQAEFNLHLQNGELTSRVSAQSGDADHISGTFNIHHLLSQQQATMQGNITANLQELGLLDAFVPDVYNLSGHLQGSLRIDGALNAPHYRGAVTLMNGSAEIPAYGLSLSQLNASLAGDDQHQLKLIANARSGEGVLRAEGSLTFAWGQPLVQAQLSGENFTAVDLPSAHVVVSPVLNFSQTAKSRQLSGTINIVSAHIDASTWRNAITNSDDVVIVSNAEPNTPTIPFHSQLQINLGNNVLFEGFGIHTNLTGKLAINSASGSGTLANGVLNLANGAYEAYGKRFVINKGSLSYSQAPLTNPTFDITAIYQLTPIAQANALNQITIGVRLLGTLQAPKLSLFSTPAMSQEDILSYIVLGMPLSQTQAQDSNTLAQAALALALSGGNKSILQGIQQQLGLNQLTFGSLSSADPESMPGSQATTTGSGTSSSANNDTALFVSKQISSRVNVSYGVGLFNAQQIFRTQLLLNRNWSIWTDNSNQGSGADLIYTIER